jgi:hypothetical protein
MDIALMVAGFLFLLLVVVGVFAVADMDESNSPPVRKE